MRYHAVASCRSVEWRATDGTFSIHHDRDHNRSISGAFISRPLCLCSSGCMLRINISGMSTMKAFLKRLVRDEEEQDLIEYALLAGFISLVAVTAITQVGQGINSVYNNINSQVQSIPGGAGS